MFKLLPETVCIVPFKKTARVLCVKVPLLEKFPATYKSPVVPDDDKVMVPVVLDTAPDTVRLPEAEFMVIVPPEFVKLPAMVVPPELVFIENVPPTNTLPVIDTAPVVLPWLNVPPVFTVMPLPTVNAALIALRLNAPPLLIVSNPFNAIAPYVPTFADPSKVPVLIVTLFG